MSSPCPSGQIQDEARTAFGLCLESLGTPSRPDPTRPVPSQARPDEGSGLFSSQPLNHYSPDPVSSSVARTVWHHLTAGLRTLSENDHGRDWPLPRRDRLRELLAEFDDDLCVIAAREAREIVEGQDRAPNITSLFEKKLRERAAVRLAAKASLEFARSQEGQVPA